MTAGVNEAARTPTIKNLQTERDTHLNQATKRDLVLVGLAGHGIQPLGSDSACFCPQDANPTIGAGQGILPSTAARPESLPSFDGLIARV